MKGSQKPLRLAIQPATPAEVLGDFADWMMADAREASRAAGGVIDGLEFLSNPRAVMAPKVSAALDSAIEAYQLARDVRRRLERARDELADGTIELDHAGVA